MKFFRYKALFIFFLFLTLDLILVGKKFFQPEELFFQGVRDPNPWFISYPWRNLVRLFFFAKEFPLWNPYSILGEPFLANYQQAVFSPFRWLFYFLPFKLIVSPMIVLELAFAGFGAWLFARKHHLSDWSAFICGAGYMLCGYLVQYLNNQHLPIDMLLPYGLLMMARLVERQSWANFFLLSLILILILLAGQPESALFTLGFIFIYFLFRCWTERSLKKPALVLFSISGFALLICLIQLLPFLEAIPQSWTFHPPGTGKEHLAIGTIASLIAPFLFGPTNLAPIPLVQIFPWVGTVLIFLSLLALGNRSSEKSFTGVKFFFFLFTLVAMGIAYGIPVVNLITRVPGLDRLIWLKYLQPVISFSLVFLASISFEQIRNSEGKIKISPAFLLCFLLLGEGFLYSFISFPALRNWAVLGFIFSFCLLLFASLFIKSPSLRPILIILILLEPMVYHRVLDRASFWLNMEKVDLSRFKQLQDQYPEARFSAEPSVWIPNLMQAVPLYDLGLNDALIPERFVRLSQYLNQQESAEELLTDFLAYHSLRLKESAFNSPVAKILSAKFFIRKEPPKKLESWVQEPGFWVPGKNGLIAHYTHTALYGDPFYVIPIKDSVPRVFFPEKIFFAETLEASFQKLLELKNFSEEAVVESAIKELPENLKRPERTNWKIGFSRVVLNYYSSAPVFAVFSEQYFPGWRSYLDGKKRGAEKKELRIYPADYVLRGVYLPAGKHYLELIYQPWGFRIGLNCFLGSICFLIFLFISILGFSPALRPQEPEQ